MNRTNDKPEPFFAWPGWPHLRYSLQAMGAVVLWFLIVYGGCDWITSHRALRVRLDFAFERRIPFLPAAVLAYMAVYPLILLAPFVLRQRRRMNAACKAMALAIAVAGVCFLLFPADLAYPPMAAAGPWRGLFNLADRINLTHNLAPSLHVALSALTALILARGAGPAGRFIFGVWALAIAASTLLTHQHHVVDAISGLLLAWAGYAWVYLPMLRAAGADEVRDAGPRSASPQPAPVGIVAEMHNRVT